MTENVCKSARVKTGTLVAIPVHPDLKQVLDSTERRSVMILTTETNRPFKASYFQQCRRTVMSAAGLGDLYRDLRRTTAVRLSEAGATPQEVAAIAKLVRQGTKTIPDWKTLSVGTV